MLDADLAEIYGYTNNRFNEQVRNNIEKIDSDFMFELTADETEYLRTNFSTANISSKSRYNPHVFTEQGLYMLMTVLKGPLAVKQSKALIKTFKRMKDYILENRDLIGQRELLQLSMETANNRIEINKINSDMISLEKQISDVAEGLKDVVTKSELADMMNSFISDDDEKWLMFNAKFSSADGIYEKEIGDDMELENNDDKLNIEKTDTIDGLAYEQDTSSLILLLTDGMDWSDMNRHLLLLQDKLNTYIWYIDSEQYKEKYPNVKSVELRVSFLFEEPEICRKLLERAKQVFVDVFENVEMIVEHGTK